MNNQELKDYVSQEIDYCNRVIAEIRKNRFVFSPFDVLEGNLDKEHQMLIECCNYLEEIERLTDDFRETLRKIVFKSA